MSLSLPRLPTFSWLDGPTLVRQLNEMRGALGDFLGRLQANARNDGVTLPSVALAGAADTKINHRLGRKPVGVDWRRPTAAATIHFISWDSQTVTLHASAACAVDLEVW